MRRVWLKWAAMVVVLGAKACSCDSGTGYVYEQQTTRENGSPAGAACTVDSECQSGRCQGGVCSTGGCEDDTQCRDGELCVFGECQPDDTFACTADTHPIIDINPADLDFGTVSVGHSETRSVVIRNLGSCLLTLQGVGLSSSTPPDFACGAGQCETAGFPRRLPPNRSYTVDVTFTPAAPGDREGQLQIRSDDETYPVQIVPMVGHYSGVPRILVEPTILDFGFVSPTATPPANAATRGVRIYNVGEGNALLTITDVRLASAAITQFTFTPEIRSPANVVTLSPTTAGDPNCIMSGGCVDLEVTFSPDGFQNYTNELLITYDPPPEAGAFPYVAVPLKGYSTTPPVVQVTPTILDFGDRNIGSTVQYETLTITNNGQTHMSVTVDMHFDSSTDFSIDQPSQFEVPVAPGNYTTVKVHYDPTVLDVVNGQILITTNDPTTYNALYGPGTVAVPVRGRGLPNMFNDILKVEMTFENGDNGFFGNDFRDVNLIVESPLGNVCSQPLYQVNAQGQIIGVVQDFCAAWTGTGMGNAQWIAVGAAREPERVIVSNITDANPPAPYRVQASYEEDCAFLPTQLLASLLGFGVDALVGYISSGTIDLGSEAISDFIANYCFDRSSSGVTITLFINGVPTMNCSKSLGAKGQVRDLATVTRTNGQFSASCAP